VDTTTPDGHRPQAGLISLYCGQTAIVDWILSESIEAAGSGRLAAIHGRRGPGRDEEMKRTGSLSPLVEIRSIYQ
jgi:hypothetical protein